MAESGDSVVVTSKHFSPNGAFRDTVSEHELNACLGGLILITVFLYSTSACDIIRTCM